MKGIQLLPRLREWINRVPWEVGEGSDWSTKQQRELLPFWFQRNKRSQLMLWWFLWGLKKQRTRGICHRSVFLSSNKQWQSNYWSYEQLSSSPERQSSYMCCAQPPARSPRTRLRQPLGNSLIGSTLLPCLQVRARSQFRDSWLGTGAPMSCAVTAGWLGERAHPAALHYPGVLQALRQPGAALASRPAVLFSLEFYFLPSDLLL